MYENLIKPVENGQFEGASTSSQWLNLKKKEVAAMARGPISKKRSRSFSGPRISKKRGRRLARPQISKKKKSPPGGASDLKKKRSRRLARPRISKKKRSQLSASRQVLKLLRLLFYLTKKDSAIFFR